MKNKNGIRRILSNRTMFRVVGYVGLSVLFGYAVFSCYRPTFTTTIYKCDGYSCPTGLVCNSDKICVNHPANGCTNGGIQVDGNTYLCPGVSNRCEDSYAVCVPDNTELACLRGQATLTDLSMAEPCRVCCLK